MSRKVGYGFGIEELLGVSSTVGQMAQITNSIRATMPTGIISQPILDLAQSMRGYSEMVDFIGASSLIESASRVGALMKPYTMFEMDNIIHSLTKYTSIYEQQGSWLSRLNVGIDPALLTTVQNLGINISSLEATIQVNLGLFEGIDWSEVIELDDLEELDIENTLNGAVININEGISFQQQIFELINKLTYKYPLLAMLVFMLIIDPIKSEISDAVRHAVKNIVSPIISNDQITDYKVISKTIQIQVNNTLNVNIECKDARDKMLKTFGYVSTEKLIMRRSNKVKSKALYILGFGQVVKIIRKNRNWTLVEYENDEDIIQGWVFTRYISKFKK